jgi:hypothetical protein
MGLSRGNSIPLDERRGRNRYGIGEEVRKMEISEITSRLEEMQDRYEKLKEYL